MSDFDKMQPNADRLAGFCMVHDVLAEAGLFLSHAVMR